MLNNLIVVDLSSLSFIIDPCILKTVAIFFELVPFYIAKMYIFDDQVPLIKNVKKVPHRKSRAFVTISCSIAMVLVFSYWLLIISELFLGKLHLVEIVLLAIYTAIMIPFDFNLSLSMSVGYDAISKGNKKGFSSVKFAIAIVVLTILAIVSQFSSFTILEIL